MHLGCHASPPLQSYYFVRRNSSAFYRQPSKPPGCGGAQPVGEFLPRLDLPEVFCASTAPPNLARQKTLSPAAVHLGDAIARILEH
jgi:hypothetical protein